MLKRFIGIVCLSVVAIQTVAHPSYYFRSFWAPVFDRYPLSWCLADGSPCGREPAKRYCKAMGYQRLHRYRVAEELAQSANTIDRKHICDSGYCKTYQVIVCKNRFTNFHTHGK